MLPVIKKVLPKKHRPAEWEDDSIKSAAKASSAVRRLRLKKVLYHPLTWLAVGFHALLLFIPFSNRPPSEEVLEDLENGPEEIVAVDLLNLSEIATSTPPPSEPPPAAPPPASLPPTSAASPVPSPAAQPEPVAEPAAEDPIAETPGETPAKAPEEKPIEEPPIEVPEEPPPATYDPGQDQSVFISNLGAVGLNDYTDQGLPPANFFRNEQNAGYFLSGDQPVQGAASARWVDKGPSDVLNQLQTSYAPTGIVFTKLENYGGEELYELTTPTGQTFMHISLVRLKGSTLLVIWQDRPA